MNTWTLIVCSVVLTVSSASVVPSNFIPIPPLPVGGNPPTLPPPTKLLTQTPVTKKPSTTKPTAAKPTNPPTTQKPTFPSSTLPSSVAVPSQSANCGLSVNVPGVQCNSAGTANTVVQQALASLQQQLTSARQQNQAQGTTVQSMITQLQTRQVAYINKISDLQNEVANLVKAFNTVCRRGPQSSTYAPTTTASVTVATPAGVSSGVLQKAVQDVKDDLSKATQDFNNRVFNLSAIIHTNEQQEMLVHQSIESQIQKQASDIGRLSQQVVDLSNLLSQLNSSLTSGVTSNSSGASASDIAKLRAQINKVASDIQLYDKNQQSQFSSLNLKASSLLSDVNNHTNEISNLRNNQAIDESMIRILDKNLTIVHDALANFRQQIIPQTNQINAEVNALKTNASKIQTNIGRIDSSVLKILIQLGTDEIEVKRLANETSQLKTDVGKMNTDLSRQSSDIQALQAGLIDLKNAIPVSELNTMNNIIVTAIQNGNGTLSTSQLQAMSQSIQTISNKLGLINPPTSSG